MSRNRNFAAYEDPLMQRAARIYRHLKSVEQTLLALGEGSVRLERAERDAHGALTLELVMDDGKIRRTSVLSATEWEILLEQPALQAHLLPLLDELTPAQRAALSRAREVLDEEE